MENIIEYKGYFAKVEFSVRDQLLYGKIEGIDDLITFQCESAATIEREFQLAVDDYLIFCETVGKTPQKAYKGSFNVRVSPELHQKADILAKKSGRTLNQVVSDALSEYLDGKEKTTTVFMTMPPVGLSVDNPVGNYSLSTGNATATLAQRRENVSWKM